MWKAIAALTVILAGQALAQGAADLGPYVAALAAADAYLPGVAKKSLHLANYDEASHRALVREAFTASILGGKIVPAAKLSSGGSTIPTGARWLERHYLFAQDQRCEVFINVGEVATAMAKAVPHYAAFSVWHELAHCTLFELQNAAADGGRRQLGSSVAAGFAAALPKGRLAYTLVNEAFADGFALLVEASVRGNDSARQMAAALLDYRRQESQAQAPEAGVHDTRSALGLALAALSVYDLSGLSARDRYVLAMNLATDGVARWAEAETGAEAASALRAQLREFESRMLANATAAVATPASASIPVFLAYPGEGRQDSLRLR